ncbi:MAG: hypothetical protein J5740_04250 [Bacteroidales bacterium]|nr:hypothetical protein [Bacteroidales bacterium]
MKRLITIITLFSLALGANAQAMYAEVGKEWKLFDFQLNAQRLEFGVNAGQAGSFSPYADFAMGANLLVNGIYVDFLASDPDHKYSASSDTKWNDHVAFCINAGYQIPILKWLRIMPVIGYAQTNDGITDASVTIWDVDEYSSNTYHPYKVTKGSRSHYFNYGGGLSIQPCKWFSVNLIATNHALYGGVGVDLLSIIKYK